MLNPVQAPGPADQAKQKVIDLHRREAELTQKRTQLLDSLAAKESTASQALADGAESVENIVESFDRDKRDVRLIEKSIDLTRRQRRAAILASNAAEAASMLAVAQQRRSDLTALTKQSDQLLGKLSVLQGCEYMPRVAVSGWDLAGSFPRPRTETLATEVASLEAKARDLEAREVSDSGAVMFKTSADALLTCEEIIDPFAITPSTHSVMAWLAAVEAKVPVEQRQLPRRYRLAWRDGSIIAGDSSLSFHGATSVYVDLVYSAEAVRA